jgi:hypothetical protein
MNKQTNPNHQTLLQFMLRAQHLARQDARSDRGSAMLIASIVTILLFSMLAAFLTITNLNRSSAVAYTKSTSTFYAAESGLNARAQLIRQKVGSYDIPSGTSPTSVTQCINAATTSTLQYVQPAGTTNDFGCQNYNFDSQSGTASDRVTGSDSSFSVTKITTPDTYIATTYIVNNPDNLVTYPKQDNIPTGDLFAGMRMLEYTHRVFSTARTQANSAPDRAVLQLDFQTRFVPMFQFAVFYNQDLEITPGPDMNINGRVHTNGNLHLTDGGTLCIAGQVSARGSIYNRRKHAGNSTEQGSNGLVYIYPNQGTCVPGLTQVAANRLENKIVYTGSNYASSLNLSDLNQTNSGNFDSSNRTNMRTRFGTNVLDRVDNIRVPSPDFLAKTDSTGALSTYYTKADLRIEMKSNPAANALPYNVASIAQGMGDGSTCTTFNVANDKVGKSTSKCTQFTAGQLHSLRQPLLVRTGQATDDELLCTTERTGVTAATSAAITALSSVNKDKLVRALQTAIVSQGSVLDYSNIKTKTLNDASLADVKTLFGTYLTSAGITTVTANDLNTSSLASIAAIAEDCFKPAPIQKYTNFYNNREGRTVTMLQTNIESLTIWNRDGLYVNLQVNATGDPALAAGKYQVPAGGDNNGQGNSASQLIFKFATIPTALVTCGTTDNLCKGSFRHLGLAGADNSEGGLVFHMTVDNNNTPNTTTAYTAGQSPYGFAITGGRQLPGALTIATDQAAYVQGDFNFNAGTGVTGTGAYLSSVNAGGTFGTTKNPATGNSWTMAELSNTAIRNGGYKFPASTLADSVNVLSSQCLSNSQILNCGILGSAPNANSTTINSAFLGGSDIMPPNGGNNYSGGWHNYPRFHENWSSDSLNVRGSYVSLGAPIQVSGTWSSTVYSPPTRNWDYDTDFNDVANLPPLTPNIVYLKQRVFSRGYINN